MAPPFPRGVNGQVNAQTVVSTFYGVDRQPELICGWRAITAHYDARKIDNGFRAELDIGGHPLVGFDLHGDPRFVGRKALLALEALAIHLEAL